MKMQQNNIELAEDRGNVLYRLDNSSKKRFSHENPLVIQCYNEYLGEPLSKRAHKLLHFSHYESYQYTEVLIKLIR